MQKRLNAASHTLVRLNEEGYGEITADEFSRRRDLHVLAIQADLVTRYGYFSPRWTGEPLDAAVRAVKLAWKRQFKETLTGPAASPVWDPVRSFMDRCRTDEVFRHKAVAAIRLNGDEGLLPLLVLNLDSLRACTSLRRPTANEPSEIL